MFSHLNQFNKFLFCFYKRLSMVLFKCSIFAFLKIIAYTTFTYFIKRIFFLLVFCIWYSVSFSLYYVIKIWEFKNKTDIIGHVLICIGQCLYERIYKIEYLRKILYSEKFCVSFATNKYTCSYMYRFENLNVRLSRERARTNKHAHMKCTWK